MADVWQEVAFWVLAVLITGAALRVVTSSNVVHAALYLVATLMGAAALYVLLFAEFVAWVQVLVYVGAIVVLMLFGLMLTRAPIGHANLDNNQRPLAALCALAVFVVTSWITITAFEGKEIAFKGFVGGGGKGLTESLGEAIFSTYVLPFEVVSMLLLAALVGAVVIARRDR
jgi:NADH-quinone oxidoreductase subunit J